MRILSTEQLRELRATGETFVLIDVQEPEEHDRQHIPESMNLPLTRPDFVRQVEDAAGDHQRMVVLYCGGTYSDEATRGGLKLEAAGFTNVCAYQGGMQAWCEAGQPVVCM